MPDGVLPLFSKPEPPFNPPSSCFSSLSLLSAFDLLPDPKTRCNITGSDCRWGEVGRPLWVEAETDGQRDGEAEEMNDKDKK